MRTKYPKVNDRVLVNIGTETNPKFFCGTIIEVNFGNCAKIKFDFDKRRPYNQLFKIDESLHGVVGFLNQNVKIKNEIPKFNIFNFINRRKWYVNALEA